jgi:hypothetical protein
LGGSVSQRCEQSWDSKHTVVPNAEVMEEGTNTCFVVIIKPDNPKALSLPDSSYTLFPDPPEQRALSLIQNYL